MYWNDSRRDAKLDSITQVIEKISSIMMNETITLEERSIPEADLEYMQPNIDYYMCQVSSTCQVLPDSPAQWQPSIKYCLY